MVEPDGSFGAWVRELRRRLGLTQGELGKRVGVGQGAVSKWELGRVVPPAATRARLAELAEGTGAGAAAGAGGR
jgi:transcriptional regulator with XRE-family HTH domain